MNFVIVMFGMAAGFVYVLVPAVQRLLVPLADLLVAARPLLIPVLVLAAAATVNLAPLIQAAAAVLLVLLVYRLTVRPELVRTSGELGKWWHAIEHGAANAFKKLGFVAATALLLGWIVFGLVLADHSFLAGQGGLPAGALFVALVALVAALGVRLAAYATTRVRAVVSVLLGAAVLSGLTAIGVLWHYDAAGAVAKWLALAAAVALVAAFVHERERAGARSAGQVRRTEQFLGLGLSLAMLSGVLLVAATASSLWVLAHPDVTPLKADRGIVATLYASGTDTVEYRHAPILAFNTDQKWTPMEVDAYVARGHVVRKGDGSEVPPGQYECPAVGPRACLRVTIRCPSADMHCAMAQPPHKPGAHVSDGAIYVRTLRRPSPSDTSDNAVALRSVFSSGTPVVIQTHVLLQYWFFYPYDEWTTRVLGARLTQRHEGDWEAVTVGLGTGERPLFVAYSAHCGGTWERWANTERAGSHPLVAVARGSQANYAEAGAQRPPDFTSCTHLPRGIGTLLGFAANVRDVTSDDWEWGAEKVVPVTEKSWPMNFPGTWGDNDVTEFKNARTFKSARGGGPASPPLQVLWQDPVKTIFCNRYWDGPEPCRSAKRAGRKAG